ncbi:hemolysin family protein [Phenylobacterium sp.]|jgi:putative hemolysin|uniref:hemolysin family protein n=1 Tax=Phenylobacterium sp. TaxID=1871053 RepID=UPI0025E08D96|nr:hemolysin family protein [Phenylobacterium sp.]|tara:strand:+ start:25384 stop:26691 length:1308 start_codon:yes stop_codon:yes gene_type:complete
MLLIAIVAVLLLLVLNGLFAMSELAVVSARKGKLQVRADRGDKGAAAALRLAEHPTRFLSSVQVGITLIGILAGAFGQATIAGELDLLLEGAGPLAPYSEAISTGVVVVCLTYLSLIVGELVPKRLALIFPEAMAAMAARPLTWLALAMGPFITLLTASTAGVLRLMGVRDAHGSPMSQEDVEMALAEGARAGLIEPAEQQIMTEVMRLGDRPVRVAMTPRRDVYWISLSDTPAKIREEIRNCPYSRIVVSRGQDVDDPLGVLHKKDVADLLMDDAAFDLEPLVHTPLFIPDTTSILRALEHFKKTTTHMAFVVDEFGNLEGVVTPIDLLEMIAGDFPEEHDGAPTPLIVERADGSFLVDGRADLMDLGDRLGETFEETEGFHTAAGLVLHRLGRIPAEGDTAVIRRYRVEVVDMDERRIDKLLFTRLEGDAEDQ